MSSKGVVEPRSFGSVFGGVFGTPGSAAVGGDAMGGRETALFCSIQDF